MPKRRHRFCTYPVATDIERIGDLCVNNAERTIELIREPEFGLLDDISVMAREAGLMIFRAMDAFAASDPEAKTFL